MRRLSLLLTVVALPGCTLLTDFDRDLTVVLEVAGDIPAPRLGLVQRSRLDDCNTFCGRVRDCARNPELNPGCVFEAEGTSYQVANEAFLFNSCVGLCASATGDVAAFLDAVESCEPILEVREEGEDTLRDLANSLFCAGDVSLCAAFFCQPPKTEAGDVEAAAEAADTTVLEACINVELHGACLVNCERLPAEYWACVAQDSYGRVSGNVDREGLAVCNALAHCAGPAE